MEKPQNVVLAVNILWASIALGLFAKIFLTGFKTSSTVSPVFVAVVFIFTLAIMALFTVQISAGKNWARITSAVFFALGLLSFPLLIKKMMESPLNSILFFSQTALQGYAFYLLFTKPANAWFKKPGKVEARAARNE
jgi:hypothetical protein